MRGEWRCVSMGCGGLYVVLAGTPEMLQWCANSLDTRTNVSDISSMYHKHIQDPRCLVINKGGGRGGLGGL